MQVIDGYYMGNGDRFFLLRERRFFLLSWPINLGCQMFDLYHHTPISSNRHLTKEKST